MSASATVRTPCGPRDVVCVRHHSLACDRGRRLRRRRARAGLSARLLARRSVSHPILLAAVLFDGPDEFGEIVFHNEQRPVRLYVYSVRSENVREVIITPDSGWGGDGCLGCGVGAGYLHTLPPRYVLSADRAAAHRPPRAKPRRWRAPSNIRARRTLYPFHDATPRPRLLPIPLGPHPPCPLAHPSLALLPLCAGAITIARASLGRLRTRRPLRLLLPKPWPPPPLPSPLLQSNQWLPSRPQLPSRPRLPRSMPKPQKAALHRQPLPRRHRLPRLPRLPRFPRLPHLPRLPRLSHLPRLPRFPRLPAPSPAPRLPPLATRALHSTSAPLPSRPPHRRCG